MPKRLSTQSTTLLELLRSRRAFVMPATQRAYAWGEDNLDRLFADAGYVREGYAVRVVPPSWLFLGTVYLADLTDGTTAIADGQQRIVTAAMIYAAARDLELEDGGLRIGYAEAVETAPAEATHAPRIRLQGGNAEFFQKWVLDRGAMLKPFLQECDDVGADSGSPPPVLTESQNNILAIRSLIVERMRALDPTDRRRLMSVFDDATELVVVTAPSVSDALNAYASTLKRGLRQADTDRLKFEIIGDAPPELRATLANHWDESEGRIGKEALQELCGFLLQNRSGSAPPPDVLTGMLETFDLPAKSEQFILETLVPSSAAYAHILSCGDQLPSALRPGLTERARMRRIQGNITTLMRCTHDEWRGAAVASLLHQRTSIAALDETLAGLERLVGVLMLVGLDTHALCKRYARVTAAVEGGQREAVAAALAIDPDMKTRARDQLGSAKFGEKPRYRMPVLLKLNDLATGEVSSLPQDVSCEHVLPQNVGRSNPGWYTVFRNASGKLYIGQHFRHRLGNMTILSHAHNREAGDKAYAVKRRIFLTSEFAVTQELANRYETWTPTTVQARTDDLVARLVKHWDL